MGTAAQPSTPTNSAKTTDLPSPLPATSAHKIKVHNSPRKRSVLRISCNTPSNNVRVSTFYPASTRGHSGATDTQNVPGPGERESQLHPSPLKAQALLLGARGGRGTHGGRGRGRTGRWAGRGYERARVLTGLEPEVLVGLQRRTT